MDPVSLIATFGRHPRGIIHVGAHRGQEFGLYRDSGAETVVYVEPIPHLFADLRARVGDTPGHVPVQALCLDRGGKTVRLNVSSNDGASSSVLGIGQHAEIYPDITYVDHIEVVSTTVDTLIGERFADRPIDLMVIDTQGADLLVLSGARQLLRTLDFVYVEVAEEPLYENGATLEMIRQFLAGFGFRMRWLQIGPQGWGDAFFMRVAPADAPDERPLRNVALHKPAAQSSYSRWSRTNDPQGAVNGIKTGSFGFHTDFEVAPWWQVDLLAPTVLEEIVVHNRIDAPDSVDRVRTLCALVSPDGIHWQTLYRHDGSRIGGIDGTPLRVPCPGVLARFVRLQLQEQEALHLDEVEVLARVSEDAQRLPFEKG